jgi:hypothetical protein
MLRSMSDTRVPAGPAARARLLSAQAVTVASGAAIFLSACLLFLLEPLVGLLVLPSFGGVPAAWATCLCFFQGVLVLGYLYGHLVTSRLDPRRGAILHAAVVMLVLGAAAVAPSRYQDLLMPGTPVAVNLLAMLALTVGPATFLMTTTTPLVSSWHVLMGDHERHVDPYWLYALSNAGSLLALLAFPLVVEPVVGLGSQRIAWLVAFGVLCLLLLGLAVRIARRRSDAPSTADQEPRADERRIPVARWARWLVLAAIPSGLLAATTNFITTDLISAPLLWVGPLAIYLVSLVVVFSPKGRRLIRPAVILTPVAVTLLWVPIGSVGAWPAVTLVLLQVGGFAVIAVALHGILALDRPPAASLTTFYLVMAVGGVVGSAFVALVAPVVFTGIWEFPILLVATLVAIALCVDAGPWSRAVGEGFAVRASRALGTLTAGSWRRLVPYAVVGGVLLVALASAASPALAVAANWLLVGAVLLVFGARPAVLAATTAAALVLGVFLLPPAHIFQERNFFGVIQVLQSRDGLTTDLRNGTTVHGSQWRDPARRGEPVNEFAASGPAGDIFRVLRAGPARGRSIGIIGLGAGELAAYAQSGDTLTAFEINPLDVDVASDPRYFTYLSDAAVEPTVVVGDGRLLVEASEPGTFDVLFLDAFTSDAVPVHLLTVEAIESYLRAARADGVLAFHLSNRYYDLQPAVTSAVEALGLSALVRNYVPSPSENSQRVAESRWLVASRDTGLLARLEAAGWARPSRRVEPLTDDHPDITRLLVLRW